MKKKTTQLRELVFSPEILVLPGTADCCEAKLVEAAGFRACYMSGGRTSDARGYPDVGFLTMNEMIANAHYIATAIEVPLLSDADTGYGNALSVRRAVQEFITAGVAGIHIEDQVFPKRCGYMPGKEVIAMEEAVGKYRAAVEVRNELDPDFVIFARTDALGAVDGTIDDAVRRAEAYRKTGVDVSWVEGAKSMEELRFIVERVEPPLLVLPMGIPLEERPSDEEMEKMGIAVSLYPGMINLLTVPILWEYLHDMKARGLAAEKEWFQWLANIPRKYPPLSISGMFQVWGYPKAREWEEKYLTEKELEKYMKSTGIAFGKEQA